MVSPTERLLRPLNPRESRDWIKFLRTRTTICLCFRTSVCESSWEGGEGEGCGGRGSLGQGWEDEDYYLSLFQNSCLWAQLRRRRRRRLRSRVQWFWHFLRNSICFMCFWFGLEILRLVYKKLFLKYWMVSILFDLLSSEKNVQKSRVWQEGKFLQKNWIFRDLEDFAKNHFLRKIFGNFLTQEFWNQHKIPLLLIPCMPNFKEIYFQLL